MSAPPPPPPHGEVPKSSGLPPGKYDIFVIPEHSAGSGFLYLPSLRPNVNSFAAGFASALILVALFQSMAPAFRTWWENFHGMGNMGILLLILGVGFGAWALGRTQKDSSGQNRGPSSSWSQGGHEARGGYGTSNAGSAGSHAGPPPPPHGNNPPPPPHNSPPPQNPPPRHPPHNPPPPNDDDVPPRTHTPPPRPPPTHTPPPRPPPTHTPPPRPPPQPQPAAQEKPKPTWQRPPPQSGTTKKDSPKPEAAKGSWEKARDEMRRKEEERKAKEAEQKRRDEAARRLAELRAKDAKERQEREKERQRKEAEQKSKETSARLERELKEKLAKEAKEKEEQKKREEEQNKRDEEQRKRDEEQRKKDEEQKKKEAEAAKGRVGSSYAYSGVGERTSMWPNGRPTVPAHSTTGSSASKAPSSPSKRPPAPTAKTFVDTEEDGYSFRPYDQPRRGRKKSAGSYAESEFSWAPSHTTARTSPPPSFRGPYTTKDPDKIVIHAVYLFMNQYAKTPASQLVSGVGSVTDGLILRITTEGLFIDDDVRGVPQREWDVKAWTLKVVETGEWKSKGLHVLRATIRDQEGKRYLFVLDETESWKVAAGLQRLKRGTQVRQLGVGSMPASEARGVLETLGWSG